MIRDPFHSNSLPTCFPYAHARPCNRGQRGSAISAAKATGALGAVEKNVVLEKKGWVCIKVYAIKENSPSVLTAITPLRKT